MINNPNNGSRPQKPRPAPTTGGERRRPSRGFTVGLLALVLMAILLIPGCDCVCTNSVVSEPEQKPSSFVANTPPTKVLYNEGETLDLAGLVLRYTDETGAGTDMTPADFAANGVTASPAHGTVLNTPGTISVTFSFQAPGTTNTMTASITITVAAKAPSSSSASSNVAQAGFTVQAPPAKTTYTEGDVLYLAGLVLRYTDETGAGTDMTPADFAANGVTASPEDETALQAGATQVTFTHAASGLTAIQTITVQGTAPVENVFFNAEILAVNEATVAYRINASIFSNVRVAVIPASQAVPSLPAFYQTFNAGGYGGFANLHNNVLISQQSFITGLSPATSYLLLISHMSQETWQWNDTLTALPFTTGAAPEPPPESSSTPPASSTPPPESSSTPPASSTLPPVSSSMPPAPAAPVWTQGPTAVAGGSAASILFTFGTDIPSTVYLVVLPNGSKAPTVAEVMAGTGSGGTAAEHSGAHPSSQLTSDVMGLNEGMGGENYDVYFVAVAEDGTAQSAVTVVTGVTTNL